MAVVGTDLRVNTRIALQGLTNAVIVPVRSCMLNDVYSRDLEFQGRVVDRARTNYETLKNWLSFCDAKHKDCQLQSNRTFKGAWVLDCEERRVVPMRADTSYIALSYVWGQFHTLDQTQLLNTNKHPKQSKLSRMP
jgi:hypothetical protein